ncbi:MAG: helix-turn-helix domain-containing protein [Bdellovibrionales bacterium]
MKRSFNNVPTTKGGNMEVRVQEMTADKKVELIEIGYYMNQLGLPKDFIGSAIHRAFEIVAICELVKMWFREADQHVRDRLFESIQNALQQEEDNTQKIRFDDLERISQNIRLFKDNLRLKVDQTGGIKRLAELTGIPQPSLSRFFSTATMPRRATLLKISRALNMSHVEIVTGW